MQKPEVIIYGASGYTGKLIAEYLLRLGIPFAAAGRSHDRLMTEMATVPGYRAELVTIVEVVHDKTALAAAFKGMKVVVNVVGPFGQLGAPVAEACLVSGCHYLDTTGEQDWIKLLRDDFGTRFANANLLCCPALAWMWAGGQLGAEIALETPGIDSIDILYAPNGAPTYASTLSFLRMVTQPQYKLVNNELATWEAASSIKVVGPHDHEVLNGLPWGGGAEPLWYENDDRVRNCRVSVAFPNSPLVDWVVSCMTQYKEASETSSASELEELTNTWGRAVASTPPREIEEVNRSVISVKARGTTVGTVITLYTTAPYLQTGALIAEGTRRLLASLNLRTGFASPAAAFGARALIGALGDVHLHSHVG